MCREQIASPLRLHAARPTQPFALRLELKDYVYGVTVPNGVDGLKSKDIQNQVFAELGVSVFFPFNNRRQP